MPTVHQMLFNLAAAEAKEFLFFGWGTEHSAPCMYAKKEKESKKTEYEKFFPVMESEVKNNIKYFEKALRINKRFKKELNGLGKEGVYKEYIRNIALCDVHNWASSLWCWIDKNNLRWLSFYQISVLGRAKPIALTMLSFVYEGLEEKEANLNLNSDYNWMEGRIFTADSSKIIKYRFKLKNCKELKSYLKKNN